MVENLRFRIKLALGLLAALSGGMVPLCAQVDVEWGVPTPTRYPYPAIKYISHAGFTLGYSNKYKQAAWVSYTFTDDELDAKYDRKGIGFTADPDVDPDWTAKNADYTHSGFDRGHLAPAADMSWSEDALRESFTSATSVRSSQASTAESGASWKNSSANS